jgi:hypothetical protein
MAANHDGVRVQLDGRYHIASFGHCHIRLVKLHQMGGLIVRQKACRGGLAVTHAIVTMTEGVGLLNETVAAPRRVRLRPRRKRTPLFLGAWQKEISISMKGPP